MAKKGRLDLKADNNTLFPTQNLKLITALRLRTFNVDSIDSNFNIVDEPRQYKIDFTVHNDSLTGKATTLDDPITILVNSLAKDAELLNVFWQVRTAGGIWIDPNGPNSDLQDLQDWITLSIVSGDVYSFRPIGEIDPLKFGEFTGSFTYNYGE